MGGLFDNFWTSRVSISTYKRNFGSPWYVFEVQFGRPVAIERKWESSEGNFTRTKAKIGVKIRRIRRFRELWIYYETHKFATVIRSFHCFKTGSYKFLAEGCSMYFWLCCSLMTRQTLRVILCCLPEKGRKEIEERVEEMKERDREERGTGMKVKKQKK